VAGKLVVAEEDMEAALEGFSPASSWGVGRVTAGAGPGPRGWQDVGGLEDVCEALQETLELPTRFAKLIARCAHPATPLGSLGPDSHQ
jgi:peroxin-1